MTLIGKSRHPKVDMADRNLIINIIYSVHLIILSTIHAKDAGAIRLWPREHQYLGHEYLCCFFYSFIELSANLILIFFILFFHYILLRFNLCLSLNPAFLYYYIIESIPLYFALLQLFVDLFF